MTTSKALPRCSAATRGYRTAIGWATICTFACSVSAVYLAQSLLATFSGKELVPNSLVGSLYFLVAVAGGAGFTVILATLTGFQISMTHVSVGALFGFGLTSRHADFRVVRNILLSWLITLPCAAMIGALIYGIAKL